MPKKQRTAVPCANCGKVLYRIKSRIKRNKNQFCNKSCLAVWQSEQTKGKNSPSWKGGKVKRPCSHCGKPVYRYPSDFLEHDNMFCDKDCFSQWRIGVSFKPTTAVVVNCYTCGKPIERELNQVKRNDKNFCNRVCWAKWRTSDEWRGANNPTYKPDLPDSERTARHYIIPEIKQWVKDVKKRDGYTCQLCGYRNGRLGVVAHHLNSWNVYPEQRIDLENGVCLCKKCHKAFHKKYGKGNNTRQQFIEFATMSRWD